LFYYFCVLIVLFFLFLFLFVLYFSYCDVAVLLGFIIMATISKVDDVTKLERDIVVDALKLKLASIGRAGKSATNPAIRDALMAEGVLVEALISRFR